MKKSLLLSYLCLVFSSTTYGQYHYQDKRVMSDTAFQNAQQLIVKGYFFEAIPHYNQAIHHFQQNKQTFARLFSEVEKAFCLIKSSQYRKARELLHQLEKQTSTHLLLLGRVLEYQALLYQRQTKKRLDKALWCANRSLALRKKHFLESKPKEVIRAYLRVAYILAGKVRYIEALERTQKAEVLIKENYSTYLAALKYHIQGLCYSNLAQLLTKEDQKGHRSNRIKGIQTYKRALQLYKKALEPTHPKVGTMWGNIGSTWQMRYSEVHDSLRRISDSGSDLDRIRDVCRPLIDSAFFSIVKGVEILEKNAVNCRFQLAYFSWYAALTQMRMENPDIQYVLRLYQKALVYIIPGLYTTNPYALPNMSVLGSKRSIGTFVLTILMYKAQFLTEEYQKSPKTHRKYLDLAWQCHQSFEKLSSKISLNIVLERAQIKLGTTISSHLHQFARCLQEYEKILPPHTLNQKSEYLLRSIEKHKKEALWKKTYAKELKKKAQVSAEDQKQAIYLHQKATFYAREVALSNPGTIQRMHAMDSVSKYRTLLSDYEEHLLQKYPTYRQLTSQGTKVSLDKIQQRLGPHQAVISYAPNLFITFVITKNTLTFKNLLHFPYKRIANINKLRGLFNAFNDNLNETQKLRPRTMKNWAKASHKLYQSIFEPVAKTLPQNIHSLIILPPQNIYEAIPFEALLQTYDTSIGVAENIKQHALINRYFITYAPSLLYLQAGQGRSRKSTNNQNDLMAQFIAPVHFSKSRKASANRGQMLQIQKQRRFKNVAGLDSLPHTEREIRKCQQVLARKYGAERVKIWKGSQATESRLKASLYEPTQIVHLATHAVSSTLSFELSKLFLYPESSKVDSLDGISYYGDITGLRNIAAHLVVLSACETGVGQDIAGEGMLSLHRAFLQMGVPKVIHSQWAVHDEATAELMVKFYEYLTQGHNEAKALTFAKRYLLHHKIKSKGQTYATYPPYYWAAFRLTQQTFD